MDNTDKNFEVDLKLERQVINMFISMPDLFDKLGINYSMHSNMFCPFHYNSNTPSAHYHTDSNLLWCYSEQKMYGSYDLIKQYYKDVDTNKLAKGLINKFGIKYIEDRLGEVELEEEVPYLDALQEFKERRINYLELCKKISEAYN
jgi:hypothetical protein